MEWLGDGDYVVVLDECHRAKNCVPRDANKESFPLDLGQEPTQTTAASAMANRFRNQGVTRTARVSGQPTKVCSRCTSNKKSKKNLQQPQEHATWFLAAQHKLKPPVNHLDDL